MKGRLVIPVAAAVMGLPSPVSIVLPSSPPYGTTPPTSNNSCVGFGSPPVAEQGSADGMCTATTPRV